MLVLLFLNGALSSISQHVQDSVKWVGIDTAQLKEWRFLGEGSVDWMANGLLLRESDTSKGVVLMSSENFPANYRIRFQVVPLSLSTVMVFMGSIQLPVDAEARLLNDYDGGIDLWLNTPNTFFAFRNYPHNSLPYISFPATGIPTLRGQKDITNDLLLQVELGIRNDKLWCKVNGEMLVGGAGGFEFSSGRAAFRIRGVNGFPAACIIHNIEIAKE